MNNDLTSKMAEKLLHKRNAAVNKAFRSALLATKHFLANLSNDDYRFIIEIKHKESSALTIYEAASPICFLSLEQDNNGLYWIAFGIESKVDRLVITQFLRLLFKHTAKPLLEDCLRIDYVFMNAGAIYDVAVERVPIGDIQYLQPETPTMVNAIRQFKADVPNQFLNSYGL